MNELVLSSEADAANALAHAAASIRAGEVAQCLAIAALCDLHQVDESVLFDGAERWIQGGADGTPLIGEFVTAEIAGLLGVSIGSAFEATANVLNLRHRHPTLWHHVIEGNIRAWEGFRVADAATLAHLDAAACERLDRLCAQALALQPWARVTRQLDQWILLADPAQAALNQKNAAARRYLHLDTIRDGHTKLWGQLDATDGLALNDALTHIAQHIDGDTLDHRRATALGILARTTLGQQTLPTPGHENPERNSENPSSDSDNDERADGTVAGGKRRGSKRKVDLIVHLDAEHLADPANGVASIDRWGHVLLPTLKTLLNGCTIRIRPIITGNALPAVDDYEVPDPMRLALNVRNPVDVFPWGTRPATSCQADHTIPYNHQHSDGSGQTHLGNLGPLSSFTHRVKTHGGWQLEQPHPGHYRWTSPLGYTYAVTPTGTIRISKPPPPQHPWWHVEPPDDPPDDSTLDAATLAGAPPDPGPPQAPLPYTP